MKGSLKDLNEIGPCALVEAFARNVGTLPETLHQTFGEGLRQRLPTGMPIQDQYQEQDQKQERTDTHAARARDGHGGLIANGRGKSGDGLRECFDAFWAAYPKKAGKDAAWKAWQKRRPSRELTATICAALAWQRQQDQWLRDGGRYVPHPATWINAGRWQDEPSTTPRVNDRTLATAIGVTEFLK
jgi:hypothetical protein